MMKQITVIVFCLLAGQLCIAQNDTLVNPLQEVIVIADRYTKENSIGIKVAQLSDSVILENRRSFTELLRFNASIYLREYGAGGTSSARFRGTGASNTAVIWNGININSVNNGQTGFNSLSVNLMDALVVRSGGGSIKYGSGAIGGTIHLNNELLFEKHFTNQILSSVGSYQSFQNLYKGSYGTEKFTIKLGVEHNISDNDYPWLGTEFVNENGNYRNINSNLNAGWKLSSRSKLNLYLSGYHAERHFSGELPNPTLAKEKYKDFHQRNLLVFSNHFRRLKQDMKAAYLTQEYHYYADKNRESYDFGKSATYLLNYDLSYQVTERLRLESFSEYTSVFGATNKIQEHNRRQFSQAISLTHSFSKDIRYTLKVRKDFNSDYEIPLVAAFGFEMPLFGKVRGRLNASTNYRVPTYNDLYWPGQGNTDLIPETAKQAAVGLVFRKKQTVVELDVFAINTEDKITWIPGGDPERPGVWVPINISEVTNKGIELAGRHQFQLESHRFNLNVNYSYVEAKDKNTGKFLIFTPKHLFNMNVGWSFFRWTSFYQLVYTGKIYTSEDNLDIFSLEAFDVSNIGVDYQLIAAQKTALKIGFKINNIYNEVYQTSPRRPMPNRNFNIHINYKF